jgi:hypothetical protein
LHRTVLVIALTILLTGPGCAVSGQIESATITSRDGDLAVRSARAAGTVECLAGPGQEPCRAAGVNERTQWRRPAGY